MGSGIPPRPDNTFRSFDILLLNRAKCKRNNSGDVCFRTEYVGEDAEGFAEETEGLEGEAGLVWEVRGGEVRGGEGRKGNEEQGGRDRRGTTGRGKIVGQGRGRVGKRK